jgi:hypothetical protein
MKFIIILSCFLIVSLDVIAGAENYHPSDEWKSWDYDKYGNAFEIKPKSLVDIPSAPNSALSESYFIFIEQDIFGDYSCNGWGYAKPECRDDFKINSKLMSIELNPVKSLDYNYDQSYIYIDIVTTSSKIRPIPINVTTEQFLLLGIFTLMVVGRRI